MNTHVDDTKDARMHMCREVECPLYYPMTSLGYGLAMPKSFLAIYTG